eukprot:COSAG05_NODE_4394_length_1533_cov_1.391911_1_plen_79_part_10
MLYIVTTSASGSGLELRGGSPFQNKVQRMPDLSRALCGESLRTNPPLFENGTLTVHDVVKREAFDIGQVEIDVDLQLSS